MTANLPPRRLWLICLCLFVAISLTACEGVWLGESEEAPLPGERKDVLPQASALDQKLAVDVNETCSPPLSVDGQGNGAGDTYLTVKRPLREVWRRDVGEGSSDTARLTAQPVISNGVVYTIDTEANVTAVTLQDGKVLWSYNVRPEDEGDTDAVISGNLAASGNLLIAATGYSEVLAMEAKTGRVLWRKTVPGPVRAVPSIYENRVYTLTIDNQLAVLDLATGEQIWRHQGSQEVAGLLGGSRVAVGGDVVIVPYTSGEVYALKAQNGRILWAENLTALRRAEGTASLSDIIAWPVVDGNQVFTISVGGTMASINRLNGRRLWEIEMGSSQTPVVAGDYLYVVTSSGNTACMARNSGRVHWLADMNKLRDRPSDEQQRWFGPELAGERLLAISEQGEVLSISPFNGKAQGSFHLPGEVHIPPIVANRTLFILDDDATLYAFR